MSLPVREDRKFIPVSQFMVYVTEECNLRCSYCFVNKQPRHMTLETARHMVDYCLQPQVSGQETALSMNFFGGEPFLRTELLLELLPYIQERGQGRFVLGATTNGTLANDQVRRLVEEGQLHLLVSLDGDEASHRFRPKVSGAESWSHLRRNLRKLISWAPSALVRMTFHPDSLNLLEKVQSALELGGRWILLSPVVEADWSGRHDELREQCAGLADWFIQEFEAGRTPPLYHHWSWMLAYHHSLSREVRPDKACPLGTQLIAFDTAGNVLPCHRYLYRKQERFGDVRHLRGLSPSRERFVHLSRAEIPECAQCPARSICGGGCRVVALEAGYGLQGVHPNHCLLAQEQMRHVHRVYHSLLAQPRFLPTLLSQEQIPLMFQEAQPILPEDS